MTIPLDKLRDVILPSLSVKASDMFPTDPEVSALCERVRSACTVADETAMLDAYEEFKAIGVK